MTMAVMYPSTKIIPIPLLTTSAGVTSMVLALYWVAYNVKSKTKDA